MLRAIHIQPWNAVFLLGFIAYCTIRHVYERRARGTPKVVRRAGAQDHFLIAIVLVGSLVLPILYLFTPLLAFADYRLPAPAPWCGAVLMASALWLFWRAHADLDPNWSVTLELREDHQLVTRGVYRLVRHPMYAAIWLFSVAQGLLLENWLAGWSAVVAFAGMYFARVSREENMMCEYFGQEYREYVQRTGRLLPPIRRIGSQAWGRGPGR